MFSVYLQYTFTFIIGGL